MPEFIHQDSVKLISSGGTHKHSFALKPLYHEFSSYFSKYVFEVKN